MPRLLYEGPAQTAGGSQTSAGSGTGGYAPYPGLTPSTHLPNNLAMPSGSVNENFSLKVAAAGAAQQFPPFRAPHAMTVRIRAGSANGGIMRFADSLEELSNGGGAALGAGEEDIFPITNGARFFFVGDTAGDAAVVSVRDK